MNRSQYKDTLPRIYNYQKLSQYPMYICKGSCSCQKNEQTYPKLLNNK
jgi:hypothetical protein